MNYFFDTEFIEHAGGVELVSIGIVNEQGARFYRESIDFNPELADEWVRKNVFGKLNYNPFDKEHRIEGYANGVLASNKTIAEHILKFVGDDQEPVFYAYYGAYDWVVFARLFGRLIDKPEHFPMYVMDIKQMMHERGLTKEWKQEVCPDPEGSHNALEDAMWNRDLFNAIVDWENEQLFLMRKKTQGEIAKAFDTFLKIDDDNNDLQALLNEILESISHYGYLRYPPRREMEESFMDRLKTELQELTDKHQKLCKFIGTDYYVSLSAANRSLLLDQANLMNKYINILQIRIELLESQSKSK